MEQPTTDFGINQYVSLLAIRWQGSALADGERIGRLVTSFLETLPRSLLSWPF